MITASQLLRERKVHQLRFSVVIPTHNRPRLLQRAVQSVLSQTYNDFEIVVVDEASSPSASSALKELNDQRVRIVRNDTPLGPAAARNIGISHARGDFIAFLDDDDWWLSTKLEESVECLTRWPEVDVVLHRTAEETDSNPPRHPCESVSNALARMLYQQPPSLDGVVVRRSLSGTVGFDPKMGGAEDLDYLIRLAKSGARVAEIPVTLAVLGGEEATAVGLDERIAGRLMLLESHPEILGDARARTFFYLRLGHLQRRAGRRWRASAAFVRSFVARPSMRPLRGLLLTLLPDSFQTWLVPNSR